MNRGGEMSRRGWLLLPAAAWAQEARKGAEFASEWKRYPDPSTELEVVRLTDPAHSSAMTAPGNRGISKRASFLLFSSDRTGSRQIFRMDLKTGAVRQLTAAAALDAASFALLPTDNAFCYFEGGALKQCSIGSFRERELYRIPEGWEKAAGGGISDDGVNAIFGEVQGGRSRLRMTTIVRGIARTVAEAPFVLSEPLMNPRRGQVIYRQGDEALWLVNADGQQNRRLRLAEGKLGPARWTPDGRTILYLSYPEDPKQLNTLREYSPDLGTDKLVAKTSQFVQFGINGDASVFIGASRNLASPTLLLLLRQTRRELTLCEHKASDAKTANPVFLPNSQAFFFQSDRHGKPAIYRMKIEKFVEETDER